jgi:hypothetical protein
MTRAQIVEHLQAIVKAARSRSNQEKAVHYDFITRTSDPDKGTSEMPRFIVQNLKKDQRTLIFFVQKRRVQMWVRQTKKF